MGSNKKQTRLLQKEKFEKQLAERKDFLLKKGVDEKNLKKDKAVKHLQAEINKAMRAIASIDARSKVIEEARLKKQKNAEKKKEDKTKSKKKKAEPEPVEKEKGKKKKKKNK